MKRLLLITVIFTLAAAGCTTADAPTSGQVKKSLNELVYGLAARGAFEDYTAGLSTSLKSEPKDILTRRPTFGAVSSKFGSRKLKFERRARQHNGVDFKAPTGSPVLASGAGEVVASGWRGAYGQAVEIDHGGGLTTIYAHLSKRMVKVGQKVRAGAMIGQVGNTGRSTGPHLHFEMRVKHLPLNPLDHVKWG